MTATAPVSAAVRQATRAGRGGRRRSPAGRAARRRARVPRQRSRPCRAAPPARANAGRPRDRAARRAQPRSAPRSPPPCSQPDPATRCLRRRRAEDQRGARLADVDAGARAQAVRCRPRSPQSNRGRTRRLRSSRFGLDRHEEDDHNQVPSSPRDSQTRFRSAAPEPGSAHRRRAAPPPCPSHDRGSRTPRATRSPRAPARRR